MQPLKGITVLDLSRVLAGPYCTAMLADLGAEVVKVESGQGDDSRHIAPYVEGESLYFSMLNRGKKSLCLNLKDPQDLERFHRLCERADVVVENFRPGVTERLGIDEATLRARYPRLIYCSISGFGQSGAMRAKPAYDIIAQALSGMMAATGPDGGMPTRIGESLGDVCAGMFASWSIAAALFARERDPERQGCHLDVSMLDCLFSMQVTNLAQFVASGQAPFPIGNRHPLSAPFDSFEANDGQVIIAVINNTLFSRLVECMQAPELAEDARFVDDEQRCLHQAELKSLIEDWTGQFTVEEVCARLDQAGVPASPIWNIAQLAESRHAEDRQLLLDMGHWRSPAQPVFFNGRRVVCDRPAPTLGQHNACLESQHLDKEIDA
ncbi:MULTISPECIES: CoA transferase [unclassified Halomonas]|uniref:CaiB/BaiF CoA transferase family protein n=1 Tax=unclassified Halomonas TaxID=2609666 RepID=UPI002096A572|nr:MULTISPECIES: CoA transferase [unclassified Halomonas]MCO7214777.1 CoA transferase [Halomonas sp. OfavH-34-E]